MSFEQRQSLRWYLSPCAHFTALRYRSDLVGECSRASA